MPRRPIVNALARKEPQTNRYLPLKKGAKPALKDLSQRFRSAWLLITLGAICLTVLGALVAWLAVDSPATLIHRAEAAGRSGDWGTALRYWRAVNRTKAAQSATYLSEAQACLALGQAAQAEYSLRRAIAADPTEARAWRLLLEILRVEDRLIDLQKLGWQAYDQVNLEERPALLRELTLGLLAELPDEVVRTTLRRWLTADENDIEANIALIRRITGQPRTTDPDRPALLAELEAILQEHPEHIGAREALVSTLADSGEPDRGRALLQSWPEAGRDARYWRLRGRWELEYDNQANNAVGALQTALIELPQDWRSWYRLARAFHILDRKQESTQAAETVRRIREVLDPLTLGPQLDTTFDHLNNTAALGELADICHRVGLSRLAKAWHTEADTLAHSQKTRKP